MATTKMNYAINHYSQVTTQKNNIDNIQIAGVSPIAVEKLSLRRTEELAVLLFVLKVVC